MSVRLVDCHMPTESDVLALLPVPCRHLSVAQMQHYGVKPDDPDDRPHIILDDQATAYQIGPDKTGPARHPGQISRPPAVTATAFPSRRPLGQDGGNSKRKVLRP